MHTWATHITTSTKDNEKDEKTRKLILWETINIVFKTTGIITWCVIFIMMLLELKRYFNFDFIPGYNSAIDDVYNAIRDLILSS